MPRISLPVGMEQFREIRERECYFVDKSHLIEELLKDRFKVMLFTRPRRFGKTLAMSMLITRFWRVCLREPDTRWNRTASMAWAGRISSFATRKTGVS